MIGNRLKKYIWGVQVEEFKRKKFGSPKKKRKPMTEEQKVAAAERLAKAREAKGVAQYKSVHPFVCGFFEDQIFKMC